MNDALRNQLQLLSDNLAEIKGELMKTTTKKTRPKTLNRGGADGIVDGKACEIAQMAIAKAEGSKV